MEIDYSRIVQENLRGIEKDLADTFELGKKLHARKLFDEENKLLQVIIRLDHLRETHTNWLRDLNNDNIPHPIRIQMGKFLQQYILSSDSEFISRYLALKGLYSN